ncbi:MAG: tRNA (adenosine(37)-N6)-threonylcarbamoyltransferase complex ATPase subunit type 1 TsaE [Firmicutes bacterium]|nr:tRNA (adenosine(37)-N6)-threonylcarbamoyltransferase complex ATPase subunit type 1 TsaE [Bacillota bacterium]
MKQLRIRSEQAMIELGELLGEKIMPGDLLFLSGDLGTGKTTLVKGIAKGMGIGATITSPTFQLIKTYYGKYRLNHLDLYRLTDTTETEILELDELVAEGITVIEWGEFLKGRFFDEYLEIGIEYDEDMDTRKMTLRPEGLRYQQMVKELANADTWS